jgi:glucokinase-like ROK family protein
MSLVTGSPRLVTGNPRLVKELNRAIVLDLVRKHGPISRVGLARRSLLNASTVSNIVGELLQEGLLYESGSDVSEAGVGRRPVSLELNPSHRYLIGVELADSKIAGVVMDVRGHTRAKAGVQLESQASIEVSQAIEAVIKLVNELLADLTAEQRQKVLGVGIGVAGLVDSQQGVSLFSPNLGWRNVSLRKAFADAFDLPVYIDNDVQAMALGEHWFGSGQGVDNLVCVTVGAGVGGGVIINGNICRGSSGSAGEIGHTIVAVDGPLCRCGNRGCLESFVGGNAIVRQATEIVRLGLNTRIGALAHGDEARITPELVIRAATDGDEKAGAILENVGRYLGIGIANMINVYNPERVILGGKIIEASPRIVTIAKEAAREYVFSDRARDTEIVITNLGEYSQAIGAATLVLQKYLNPLGLLLV